MKNQAELEVRAFASKMSIACAERDEEVLGASLPANVSETHWCRAAIASRVDLTATGDQQPHDGIVSLCSGVMERRVREGVNRVRVCTGV